VRWTFRLHSASLRRRMKLKRTAKACGPDLPTLGSSSPVGDVGPSGPTHRDRRATEATKPGLRGERVISRKTIAQGRPECFGEPVVTNSCVFYFCTRGCGCAKHPAFPAPSDCRGTCKMHRSGARQCRGKVESYSPLSCPASSGASSIPEASWSSTAVSGILDRPVEPGDDTVIVRSANETPSHLLQR
jgi:hypothetical protein